MRKREWMKWIVAAVLPLFALSAAYATEAAVAGDTYVNSAHPATNYGSLSNLYVGNGGTALIQFNLSSLPAGTTASQIGKATLTVFVNRINTSGLVSVLPVTGAWSESTVTYASIPTLGATTASFTPAVAGQFVTIDVTALVQGWVTTPATNFGLALSSSAGSIVLDSKENDETGHTALLDITVVNQGAQGPQGPTGATGPAGPTGLTGPAGPTGATGNTGLQGVQGSIGNTGPEGVQGPAGATFAAAWAAATQYQIGDMVSESSTSYIALTATKGVDPSTDSGANWTAVTPYLNRLGNMAISLTDRNDIYPAYGTAYGGNQEFTGAACSNLNLGDIVLSVNGYLGGGAMPADGRTLQIIQYAAMFSVIGVNFGGNGTSNFNLPDLRPFAPVGLQYNICVGGIFPSHN